MRQRIFVVIFFPAPRQEDLMGKFALGKAVGALLMCFPASAEEPRKLPSNAELLKPSPDNTTSQAFKIVGYACKEVLFVSPMSAAADLVGEVVTDGRGKIAKFIVKVISDKAATGLCDALVIEPPKPELDHRKSFDFSSTRPTIYEQITGTKAPMQEQCSADQFYSPIGHVCVTLQVTPICQPDQSSDTRQCTDISSLISTPNCPDPQFYSALEQKCVLPLRR
jgi:hypothetical protein